MIKKIRRSVEGILWMLAQFGVDPVRTFRAVSSIPYFIRSYARFRINYKGKLRLKPCLHDRFADAGEIKSEYFWQDLIVAQMIYLSKPEKHVDVGSRLDGFIAHIASFREVEVFDIRPMKSIIPNVIFHQADFMDPNCFSWVQNNGYSDSLSCLHALEHFGLGRYGDAINAEGYKLGIVNMSRLLKPKGTMYLSIPIGRERTEFNAHRVFDPREIINYAGSQSFVLKKLIIIKPGNHPKDIVLTEQTLSDLAQESYQLGLFIFKKV